MRFRIPNVAPARAVPLAVGDRDRRPGEPDEPPPEPLDEEPLIPRPGPRLGPGAPIQRDLAPGTLTRGPGPQWGSTHVRVPARNLFLERPCRKCRELSCAVTERPRLAHVVVPPLVAARIARRADLVKQALRRQLGELIETRIDDRLVGIELVGHRRTRRVRSRPSRQVPAQLTGDHPVVDRAAFHSESPRQLGIQRDGSRL